MYYNIRYHVARWCLFMLMLFGHTCSNCTTADDCHSSSRLLGQSSAVISKHEERDLELFGSINQSHAGVFSVLDKTYTKEGKKRLKEFLQNPTTDVALIQTRQKQLALFLENGALRQEAKTLLKRVKMAEDDLLYFINNQEGRVERPIIESFYFQNEWIKDLNKSSTALSSLHYFKPVGLLFPIAEHIAVHMGISAMRDKFLSKQNVPAKRLHGGHGQSSSGHGGSCSEHGDSHGGAQCIGHIEPPAGSSWLVKKVFTGIHVAHWSLHLYGILEMRQKKKAELAIINQLYKKIAAVKEGLGAINLLSERMREQGVLSERTIDEKENPFRPIVATHYFDSNARLGYFSPVGKTLHDYQLLKKNTSALQDQVARIADIDALVSIAEWYKEQEDRQSPVCFVNFVAPCEQPTISLKDMWHIGLDPKSAVVNDVSLGEGANKLIITGPNKGGKSSYMDGLGTTLILAQVFGVAPARQANLTLFDKIVSYKVVASDISKGHSTFVAELQQADKCVQTARSSSAEKPICLLVDDQLLKSTSHQSTLALSNRFLAAIGEHPHCCALIATQHAELTQFEQEKPAVFKNLRIKMHVDQQGNRKSLFKVEEGVADPADVLSVVEVEHPVSF